jgi:hypothetical protein
MSTARFTLYDKYCTHVYSTVYTLRYILYSVYMFAARFTLYATYRQIAHVNMRTWATYLFLNNFVICMALRSEDFINN